MRMQGSRTENKKIINASPLEYDGIFFKSKLEKMAYQTLKEQGFPVQYEPKKFIIWEGFRPNVPFYNKDASTRMLKMDSKKVIDISYTPDLMFEYNNHLIIIEMKGFENNTYPLKKKIFRKWLESNYPNSIYFEIFTKKQLLQAIDIIKNLD
uniref:Endonuclease n=1 Tax=CrAss-like virus sp. ctjK323 TaxID=2825839 RepID=A0A8S5Q197_9CAUD|nr:MAG TPA: Endonuclease [CrAss-like virus sp. ctjK323]DAU16027.1 MAG TPA: Endonuclease [Caudoviricetes sp.]